MRKFACILIGAISCYGCAKKTVPAASTSNVYSEDLTVLHPTITTSEITGARPADSRRVAATGPVVTEADITAQLDSLALIVAEKNLQKRYIDGYTVQVYSGPSRDQANNARAQVLTSGLGLTAQVVYVQPNYRVKVGRFYSRLEANKVYSQMRDIFPNPLLLPEKFPID